MARGSPLTSSLRSRFRKACSSGSTMLGASSQEQGRRRRDRGVKLLRRKSCPPHLAWHRAGRHSPWRYGIGARWYRCARQPLDGGRRQRSAGGCQGIRGGQARRAQPRACCRQASSASNGVQSTSRFGETESSWFAGAMSPWRKPERAAAGLCLKTDVRYDATKRGRAAPCWRLSPSTNRRASLKSKRSFLVDDAGTMVNPMLVNGRLVGGLAQGLGKALVKRIVYDDRGRLVNRLADGLWHIARERYADG